MDETPIQRLRRVQADRAQREPEANRQRHIEASRRALVKVLKKKLSTSFVGALAQFEKFFGHLWGHGLSETECSEAQLSWRALWEECRNAVLDNGNHQVRGVESEMLQYEVSWLRQQLHLKVRDERKDQ